MACALGSDTIMTNRGSDVQYEMQTSNTKVILAIWNTELITQRNERGKIHLHPFAPSMTSGCQNEASPET